MTTVRGTNGDDLGAHALNGTDDGDLMNGFDGNDELFGKGGNDNIHGDGGNDKLFGGDGNDVLDGGLDGDPFNDSPVADSDTLDGGAGIDTANYARVQHGMFITLAGHEASSDRNADELISIENVTGTNFDDLIIGDGGANGLQGGAGNDVLVGGLGKDTLSGSTGADTFEFDTFKESPVGNGHDIVSDFRRTDGDHLDLHFIDASGKIAGDQAFNFVGAAAFSGVAGELNAVATTGGFIVSGDINGDKVGDFQIEVHTTLASMAAGDFIL